MSMKRIVLIAGLIVGIFCCKAGYGQASYTSLQYSIGAPLGDLKDHTAKASFRGMRFEYQRLVTRSISVGADLSWNVFYERKSYDSYSQGTVTVSGVQYRYNNTFPVYLTGRYYLSPEENVNPYAGLSIGSIYNHRNTDMGLYALEEENWRFALAPAVGVMIETSPLVGLLVDVRYNSAFASKDSGAMSYLTFTVGAVWKKY